MAIVTTDNKHYSEIAAAIRAASGSTDLYTPAQMAAAILKLGKKLTALIPAMDSNTSPYGTAGATTYNSGQEYRAYFAFDGNASTYGDVWYGKAYALETRLFYLFPIVQREIKKVSLSGYIDGGGALTDGVIEYTEDGVTWKTLVSLNSVNFGTGMYDVSVDKLLGIRVGASATNNGRGMIVSELQVYGLV